MFHCYKNHLYFEALINTTESTKLGILLFSPTMSKYLVLTLGRITLSLNLTITNVVLSLVSTAYLV